MEAARRDEDFWEQEKLHLQRQEGLLATIECLESRVQRLESDTCSLKQALAKASAEAVVTVLRSSLITESEGSGRTSVDTSRLASASSKDSTITSTSASSGTIPVSAKPVDSPCVSVLRLSSRAAFGCDVSNEAKANLCPSAVDDDRGCRRG